MKENASILDVCCGSKMFWFDRDNPGVVFMDKRRESHLLPDKTSKSGYQTLVIDPDVIGDFTSIPFPDNLFSIVVFDPPHLLRIGTAGWLCKKYGKLTLDWRNEISKGFSECFRVLKSSGVLIFKWNETDVPVSHVLALTQFKPLIGQRCGKKSKTHWVIFNKD